MKRKLTNVILSAAVVVSLCMPVFAADCGNTGQTTCFNDLLWQVLYQCGGCGGQTVSATDLNEAIRLWLTQECNNRTEKNGEQQAEALPEPHGQHTEAEAGMPSSQPADENTEEMPPETPLSAETDIQRAYEREVVRLVNLERAKYGLSALIEDEELSRIARIKSADMHDNGYFDHNSPTYGTPFQMLKDFGIRYRTAGENIAMGYASPEAVVNAWMNSSGHRANILNASYSKIGVGLYERYWTQHFVG